MPRYIDVDMLWDKISRAYQFEDKRDVVGYIKQCLNEAHTADVQEVKRGKWIEKPTIAYCSNCHVHWTKSFIISLRKTYKYCPNCGARMEDKE